MASPGSDIAGSSSVASTRGRATTRARRSLQAARKGPPPAAAKPAAEPPHILQHLLDGRATSVRPSGDFFLVLLRRGRRAPHPRPAKARDALSGRRGGAGPPDPADPPAGAVRRLHPGRCAT